MTRPAPGRSPISVLTPTGQLAIDTILSRTFLEDAAVEAAATLDANDIRAFARFGFLQVETVDSLSIGGNGQATIQVRLPLKDPNSGTVGGRVTLPELLDAVNASTVSDITDVVAPPDFTGSSAHLTLPVTVTFGIHLVDDDADGKIFFDELDVSQHITPPVLNGQVRAELPVFAPTESIFLRDIELTITNLGDVGGTASITTPDFDFEFGEFDILNNLGGMIDALDLILGGVQDVLGSEVLSSALPMIGDGLLDAADFIMDIRTEVLQELQNRFAETSDKSTDDLQTALFFALGPENLDLLADVNGSGDVTAEDITVTRTDNDMDGEDDDQVDVAFRLGKSLTFDSGIDFDVGVPGLGLNVDGDVQLELAFGWDVSFGVRRVDGFYLNTTGENELTFDVTASIPDFVATGRLAFLQLRASDEDADPNPNNNGQDVDMDGVLPSSLDLTLAIDLREPESVANQDGRFTFDELTAGGFQH